MNGTRNAAVQRSSFRADIQGLRAVAVLLVIADHTFGWPTGGFIGVDVFFVISGFLITGLLIAEYERTGRVSLARFYLRRLKRIVPAASVVVLITVALAWALFAHPRATSISWDALWASLFVANWNFGITGTDYFQQGLTVSPLQHYWSLSVEEQFYAVWPWLLLGLLAAFSPLRRISPVVTRVIVGICVAAVVAASLGWAFVQTTAFPTMAYFSTLTRAWELGAGALLAIAAPLFVRLPAWTRPVLAYAGLAGIVASAWFIGPETAWPAPWAIAPIAATTLVLAAGIGTRPGLLAPLTNPVMVFVGNISYSLYLWHFPVLVFGRSLTPESGLAGQIGMIVTGFALASAQYYAIEHPLWKSPPGSTPRPDAWKRWRRAHLRPAGYGLVAGTMTLTLAVGTATAIIPLPAILGTALPPASAPPPNPEHTLPASTPEIARIQELIRGALASTTWPGDLAPSVDELDKDDFASAWVEDGCLAFEEGAEKNPIQTAERCVYGSPTAKRVAVIVGDSIAISWFPAVRAALGEDWRIHILTMQQCPFANVPVRTWQRPIYPKCDAYHAYTLEQARRLTPDLTILSQADNTVQRVRAETDAERIALLEQAITAAATDYASVADHVFLLPGPPPRRPVADCYSTTGGPADCTGTVGATHQDAVAILERATVHHTNASVTRVDQLFCSEGSCPPFVDNTIVLADDSHLTQVYGERLGTPLRSLLLPNTR